MRELHDWQKFRSTICALLDDGVGEDEISSRYHGKSVRWKGVVKENNLHQQYAKGLAMKMSSDLLPIKDGRFLRANHVALPVKMDEVDDWPGCDVGDCLAFEAVIGGSGGLLGTVELISAGDEPEVLLVIQLGKCRLIENLGDNEGDSSD